MTELYTLNPIRDNEKDLTALYKELKKLYPENLSFRDVRENFVKHFGENKSVTASQFIKNFPASKAANAIELRTDAIECTLNINTDRNYGNAGDNTWVNYGIGLLLWDIARHAHTMGYFTDEEFDEYQTLNNEDLAGTDIALVDVVDLSEGDMAVISPYYSPLLDEPIPSRYDIVEAFVDYIEEFCDVLKRECFESHHVGQTYTFDSNATRKWVCEKLQMILDIQYA